MKTKGSRNKSGVKKIISWAGYIEIFEPTHPLARKNGYLFEHRKIAWDAGLLTNPSDEVHHINGIKTDNRLDNFQILSRIAHSSITWKGKERGKWTKERRERKSLQMMGNKNWAGKTYQSPELTSKPITTPSGANSVTNTD